MGRAVNSINKFKPMMTRVDLKKIDVMVEASKEAVAAEMQLGKKPESKNQAESEQKSDISNLPGGEAIAPEIEFDDFAKVDLRVALIKNAEHVDS